MILAIGSMQNLMFACHLSLRFSKKRKIRKLNLAQTLMVLQYWFTLLPDEDSHLPYYFMLKKIFDGSY